MTVQPFATITLIGKNTFKKTGHAAWDQLLFQISTVVLCLPVTIPVKGFISLSVRLVFQMSSPAVATGNKISFIVIFLFNGCVQ